MLALCRLTIPFSLALPDGHAQPINYLGELVSISFERGVGKRVYSFGDDERATWLDEAEGRHFYRMVYKAPTGEDVVGRVIACRDDMDRFVEGFVDTVPFTAVAVAFEVDGEPLVEDDERIPTIKAKALEIVRYFLNAYRTVAADPDVYIPAENDSPIVDVYAAEQYELNHEGAEGSFKRFSRQVSWRLPEENGVLKGELGPDDRQRLRTRLEGGQDVPVHLLTMIDARHQSQASGEHRLAIVLAATAFELFVQVALTEECEARGIDSLPTGVNGAEAPAGDLIQRGRIRDDLLGRFGTLLTGTNLKGGPEYQAWYQRAYRPRNEFVHQGRLDATAPQAQEAFEATIAYMNLIARRLADSRPGV
jgi:hypothetical protein